MDVGKDLPQFPADHLNLMTSPAPIDKGYHEVGIVFNTTEKEPAVSVDAIKQVENVVAKVEQEQ